MGATDDDYTTHSSQNYLMLALIVAFQVSGEEQYLQEIDVLLGFLRTVFSSGTRFFTIGWMVEQQRNPTPIFIVWGAMCRRSSSSTNWLFSKICTVFVQFAQNTGFGSHEPIDFRNFSKNT